MNEEILAGLKYAAERGFSIEESVQSFINAGYNPSEVRETASFLSRGFAPLPTFITEETIQKAGLPLTEQNQEQKKKASKKTIWIIAILVALVVISLAISILLFKDKFLAIIDSIFP